MFALITNKKITDKSRPPREVTLYNYLNNEEKQNKKATCVREREGGGNEREEWDGGR